MKTRLEIARKRVDSYDKMIEDIKKSEHKRREIIKSLSSGDKEKALELAIECISLMTSDNGFKNASMRHLAKGKKCTVHFQGIEIV